MFSEDEFVAGPADVFGFHYLVGFFVAEHSVLVNPGFVSESVGSDYGFVWLDSFTCDTSK